MCFIEHLKILLNTKLPFVVGSPYEDRRKIESNHDFVPNPIWWSKSYIINSFEYSLTNPVQYVSVAWTTHYHMHTIKEKKGVLSIVITTSFLKGKFMNASKFKLRLEFKTMWVSFQCVTIIIKKVCFCIIMRYSPNGLAIFFVPTTILQIFGLYLICEKVQNHKYPYILHRVQYIAYMTWFRITRIIIVPWMFVRRYIWYLFLGGLCNPTCTHD